LNQNVSISLSGINDCFGKISRLSKGVELTTDDEFNQSSFWAWPYLGPYFKIQNMLNRHQTLDKSSKCLGHWTFEFGYCLEFEYCDLGFYVLYDGRELLQSYWIKINFDVSLCQSLHPLDIAR